MFRKWFCSSSKPMIDITKAAWKRLSEIQASQNAHGFLFAAESGGCSGLSYKLDLLQKEENAVVIGNGKIPTTIITREGSRVYVDPLSEMFLVGAKIDYVEQNIGRGVFDSKFTFEHEAAMTCGCGSSFMPTQD